MPKLATFFSLIILHLSLAAAYNVVSYGARGDGRTDSTSAFLRAWAAACKSATPASVSVPRGRYLVRTMRFTGPCRNRILFEISGTMVAPDNYNVIGQSDFWILFYKVSRLSVVGGTIDAKGSKFWSCRRSSNNCPRGARVSKLIVTNVQQLFVAVEVKSYLKSSVKKYKYVYYLKVELPENGSRYRSSRAATWW